MVKPFVAIIEVEFTSDQQSSLENFRKGYDNSYGLFQSLGIAVRQGEIVSDGGSVMAKTGLWIEEFHYTLYLELQSMSYTRLHHQIAIALHWAELVSANANVLQILERDDTLS